MAYINGTSTHSNGNVTLYGYTATHDGAGNVVLTAVEPSEPIEPEEDIDAQVRHISAKVELYSGSALAQTFAHDGVLQSIEVERTGEQKFFGFCIGQKAKVTIIDTGRALSITTGHSLKIYFSGVKALPTFYVTEVARDENTNALTITAYDALNDAGSLTVAELGLSESYDIATFAAACASLLGLSLSVDMSAASAFATTYEAGANFEGTESVRNALNAVAEATQTVCFIDGGEKLTFKRLDKSGAAALTIDRSKYFTLDSKTNKRLATICHATELGDNVSASTTASGSTQYVRDNPFWDLRDDIGTLVSDAVAAVGGLTLNQFELDWRGDFTLELGDKLALETKDGGTVTSYLLDDIIKYDGSYRQETRWAYEDSEDETEGNPASIGDALKQTYARVDKANKRIDLVASDVSDNAEAIAAVRIDAENISLSVEAVRDETEAAIAALQINTNGISASVERVQETTQESIEGINGEIVTLTNRVNAQMTAEDVTLQIQQELDNGVDKVTTETGYTFDADGLHVAKTGSEMETTISEDGMSITRSGEEVLRADNEGVKAEDLHATTYLIIGESSRFEDYTKDGELRTGCFWIGS